MMFKHSISIVCAGLALTGCTMIPKYERPAAPVAAQYPGTTGPQKESAASDIAWRDFFAEERLKKLIELALANNRDLRVAVLNVEQSRAQYRITRSASFPTVDGSGSYTRSPHVQGSGMARHVTDQWSASLGTTAYELDLFGRVRSLNKQALEKYLATEEAQRSAQISLVAEVATQYFTLRQAEEQLQLARQTLAAVQDSYALNKATFDAGASNELDLRTAEGQVQTAKINVLTYERQLAQAQNALVLLVGQPLPTDLPAPQFIQRHEHAGRHPGGTALRTRATPRGHPASRAHLEGREREHRRGSRRVLPHHHVHRFGRHDQRGVREAVWLGHGRLEFFAAGYRAHFHGRPEPRRSGFRESEHAH